ncbi:hypothetical protein HNQ88_003465 [Aureibacter tunicatorum]|uniref:Uncharacterized protein n=1 Tax=Aureibacter tunicatorum TaxID=866807 RepID=A0AAE4BRN7_9BACT|nr:hypothetical protein [Aureibacter tunicatorum]BDD05721.1 hypothetical protein AUTU_32040 [Aureibacter tunicatorum]
MGLIFIFSDKFIVILDVLIVFYDMIFIDEL